MAPFPSNDPHRQRQPISSDKTISPDQGRSASSSPKGEDKEISLPARPTYMVGVPLSPFEATHLNSLLSGYTLSLPERGMGNNALVCPAVNLATGAEVAIKMPWFSFFREDPQGGESAIGFLRFRTEAGILSNLDHPNLLRVTPMQCPATNIYYFEMPAAKIDLGRAIGSQSLGNLSIPTDPKPKNSAEYMVYLQEKVIQFLGLCDAVQYFHEQGLVHRDIKPANILMSNDNRMILCDAGSAAMYQNLNVLPQALAGDLIELNQWERADGRFEGTTDYFSDEQQRLRLDPRCDQYSLGRVLREIVSIGQPSSEWAHANPLYPFNYRTTMIMRYLEFQKWLPDKKQILSHRYGDSKGDVNALKFVEDVLRIAERASEHRAPQRYPSVSDLKRDLVRALQGEPLKLNQSGYFTDWRDLTFLTMDMLGLRVAPQ